MTIAPPTAPAVASATFLSPHPAWTPHDTTDAIGVDLTTDPHLTEYFNHNGTLTDAALDLLHEEWASGRMV